ncbi:3-deoxy-manno-octulosonate cytidylyltransferase [Porphyromonas macacae]|uniref:3-deoxy-manno-octulosonate cytidylyltransferase n=1 Tax=Porphyromonas macacae TaxID=28115 RepID=UPI0035A0D31A
MERSVIAIIPARYASTRFPGKPLASLGGRPVIEHVVKRAESCVSRVVVATDDERIFETVRSFGCEAVMTAPTHRSGTDRCIEAFNLTGKNEEIIINLQGDEPFIRPDQIKLLISLFDEKQVDIATLAEAYPEDTSNEQLFNPNQVKVVRDIQGRALYFSRHPIPYQRGEDKEWCRHHTYLRHIGMYAFRSNVLPQLGLLSPSTLEQAESLEQLRWLENNFCINVGITDTATIGIDTAEDLQKANEYLRKNPFSL